MPVLLEAISVVVRLDAITARLPGGWAAFLRLVPNRTLCADADVARVGFMDPLDVKAFVDALEGQGLRFLSDDGTEDILVVDQVTADSRSWLEVGNATLSPGQTITVGRFKASGSDELVCPAGWTFEGSLSAKFAFFPARQALNFLRTEKGADIYLDTTTGKEVWVDRASVRSPASGTPTPKKER
jgi:hypothetical protein